MMSCLITGGGSKNKKSNLFWRRCDLIQRRDVTVLLSVEKQRLWIVNALTVEGGFVLMLSYFRNIPVSSVGAAAHHSLHVVAHRGCLHAHDFLLSLNVFLKNVPTERNVATYSGTRKHELGANLTHTVTFQMACLLQTVTEPWLQHVRGWGGGARLKGQFSPWSVSIPPPPPPLCWGGKLSFEDLSRRHQAAELCVDD